MFPTATSLPDPLRHAAFYEGVPMKRAIAWVADTLVVVLFCSVFVVMTLGLGALLWVIVYPAVSFVYRWATIANWGATGGMALMGLRVIGPDGTRPTSWTAFLHTLFYTIVFFSVILQVLSAGLMLTGPRAQGLHDLALGTAVINRPA
jgi:uncharacterized RDD family membrane protein YckC